MSAKVIPITRSLDEAWSEYLDRKATAERTGDINDGIAAGRAWRRWLDCFMTPEQRSAIGGAR